MRLTSIPLLIHKKLNGFRLEDLQSLSVIPRQQYDVEKIKRQIKYVVLYVLESNFSLPAPCFPQAKRISSEFHRYFGVNTILTLIGRDVRS